MLFFQDASSVHLSDCIQEFTREEVLDGDEKPVSISIFDDPYLLPSTCKIKILIIMILHHVGMWQLW